MDMPTLKALIKRPCFWIGIVTLLVVSGEETGALTALHIPDVYVKWIYRVLIGLAVWFPGVGAVINKPPSSSAPLLALALMGMSIGGCTLTKRQQIDRDLKVFANEAGTVAVSIGRICEKDVIESVITGIRGGAPGWLAGAISVGECVYEAIKQMIASAHLTVEEIARGRAVLNAAKINLNVLPVGGIR